MTRARAGFMPYNLEREGKFEVRLFPVLCSWCLAENVRTIVRMSEVEGSHGICEPCSAGVLAEIEIKS